MTHVRIMHTRTRLTGLSDACRRHTVTLVGRARRARRIETLTTYDPATGIETTVTRTDGQTPVVTRSLHGVPLEKTSLGERRTMSYDAFARNVFTLLENATTGATNRTECIEYDISGNVVRQTVDYGADGVAVSTAEYDMLNRMIRRTDALGHVTETAYDAFDRPVFTGGDTYPLRTGYDTQGRKTGSSTTRNDGATWNETQWEFDPASGVNTAKVYADGSRISYNYTDTGQRTRTTWARGAWKQQAYNERNLVSGTTYSGTVTPSVSYTYADSEKLISATLSDGTSYAYAYDDSLLCTNEVVTLGEDDLTVARTYDGFRRNEETVVAVTNVRHAAKVRLYDTENRVCGYALTNSLGRGMGIALSYDGSYLTNMVYALPNGNRFALNLSRKTSRKELVTLRDYSFGGQSVYWYSTDYDLVGRPTSATDSVSLAREWQYNNRSELAAASVGTNLYGYSYDTIGNRLWSSNNAITNSYTANHLNQYSSILRASAPPREPAYDADGNTVNDGVFAYAYDAENRLISITAASDTNGAIRVLNAYDHRNRRIRKTVQRLYSTIAPPPSPPVGIHDWETQEAHTFVWDGNNIVFEKVEFANGTTRTFEYFWGVDKSGSEQGAGGVGGLIAVSMDGVFYIPCYDHNGNIILYVSETGNITAQYTYDPYGNIIESCGPLADVFTFGFSTQYHDRETGMVGYKRRFYLPPFGRWLNRDPIEERGGANLYCFVRNRSSYRHDYLGLSFGSVGPNTGSVVELYDGRSYPYVSDLWFAVYGDSSFNLRRHMKISGCDCASKIPVKNEFNYFSIPQGKMYFGQGKLKGSDEWVEQPAQYREMYYAELISRSSTSLIGIKGTVEVRVQLTHSDVRPSDVVPNPSKDEEGFGTENRAPYGDKSSEHPITNFKIPDGSGWQPEGVIAEISFTLILDCDNGIRLKSPPTKTGDWSLDGQNWHRAYGKGLPPRASGLAIELSP